MKRFFLYAVALLATSAGFVSCAEDKVEPNPVLTADVESFSLTGLNETLTITLTAPGAYEIDAPEWITVNTPAARANNATAVLKLTAHVNDSGAERAGEIVFKSAGLTYAIPVTQAATPAGKYVYSIPSAMDPSYIYSDTIVVEWSGAAATSFIIGDIDPCFKEIGLTYADGYNYVTANFKEGKLYITPETDTHLGGAVIPVQGGEIEITESYIFTFGETADVMEALNNINGTIEPGYLYSTDDYQTLQMPGAFFTYCIMPSTQEGAGLWEAYNGGITYTRVTEEVAE